MGRNSQNRKAESLNMSKMKTGSRNTQIRLSQTMGSVKGDEGSSTNKDIAAYMMPMSPTLNKSIK